MVFTGSQLRLLKTATKVFRCVQSEKTQCLHQVYKYVEKLKQCLLYQNVLNILYRNKNKSKQLSEKHHFYLLNVQHHILYILTGELQEV